MSVRLFGLLAALVACAQPLPPGIERIAHTGRGQSFHWSPVARRLAFVEGRFPDRTRLVVLDPESGGRARHRLKGYVLGGPLALSRDGVTVLLEAGKLGRYASRDEPAQRALLAVDAASGSLELEKELPRRVVAIGAPAWAGGPVAVWHDGRRQLWLSLDGRRGVSEATPTSLNGVLLDSPLLVAVQPGRDFSRVSAYDLLTGAELARWTAALTPALHGAGPDGRALASRWVPGSGHHILESLDPRSGRAEPRLEADGPIETVLETESALYAVAKDPSRPNTTGRDWLAPRRLLVIERGGARWTVPWTMRAGQFLGAESDGRLWFAVNGPDRPGAWRISPARETLALAAPALDGDLTGLGPAARFIGLRALAGLVAVGALLVALFALRR